MKKIIISSIIIFLFLLSPKATFASNDFTIDTNAFYDVRETGETQTTFDITLQNESNDVYAENYTLNLTGFSPENIELSKDEEAAHLDITRENDNYQVKIIFDDIIVGARKKRDFTLTFTDKGFAKKTGEVWEVQIPKLSDKNTFRNYNVLLRVPKSFGQNAFVSPEPVSESDNGTSTEFRFTTDSTSYEGISAGFGEFQVFKFSINYHLENPLGKSATTQIALPPDTSFQRVYYTNITSSPEKIDVDADGNWIATYQLKPREKADVNVFGSVQLFSSPIDYLMPSSQTLYSNTLPIEFWQSDDTEIKNLAQNLKTPKRIYQYVIDTLTYDYQRVKPNIQRYGAKEALINKQSAICMEYTDLFIAIARAAGIPAREVNGYAYTENPEIQPLSIVADVLHDWPEYWDGQRNAWIPIDPTWGDTTGGVDYFSKLDLRHITFVNHGIDSQMPYPPGSYKLGPDPKKDIFVSFGILPEERTPQIEIVVNKIKKLPLSKTKIDITFKNIGPSAFYGLKPTVSFDKKVVQENYINIIPPSGSSEMEVSVPFSLFGKSIPENIIISAGKEEVSIKTYKNQLILLNIATVLSLFVLIIIILLHKSGKLEKYYSKIGLSKLFKKLPIASYAKRFKKNKKDSF